MTRTTNTVGSSPDGVSDVRSTATVNTKLSDAPTTDQRCVGCPDLATVRITPHLAYCDIHAGDALRPVLRQIQIRYTCADYVDSVIDLNDVIGQGTFVRFDLRYPRRERMTFPLFNYRTKPFRFGLIQCDRCAASWIGIEHELCQWCVTKAYQRSEGSR